MKSFFSCLSLIAINTLFCDLSYASLSPRATITSYGGSDVLARADVMGALWGNCRSILWADIQSKYGEEATYMGGFGLGYRQIYHQQQILGAYTFIDYNHSQQGNSFWVLSPGVESMGNIWDLRVNGYFPISSRIKSTGTDWGDNLGINQYVVVTGHQQFNHFFDLTEEVGNGVDGEVGRVINCMNNSRVYLGGYYFNINDNAYTSVSSVQGVSARFEYPVRPHLALQLVETYDNLERNTILVGLQFSLGGYSHDMCRNNIATRILDPVSRNLSTQSLGTGIPIVKGLRDQGVNVLERDNIYFFNATRGAVFDPALGTANGTAENPLIGTSFTQANINSIATFAPNANFYFTPGTYTFAPVPNGRIALNNGQSMWGRIQDYTANAQGDNRALFLGGLDLFEGNNRLDSIQLLNSAIGPTSIIALHIENANNVLLFNDNINAITTSGATTIVDNNHASGIYANNSQVIIKDSNITATAIVTGINNGFNAAAGMGGNSDFGVADFVGNQFTIANSTITGNAIVNGINNLANFASGIGGNTLFGNTNFIDNSFTILNSTITGNATINGINNLENFATGIGGNYGNFFAIGNANFTNNIITLIDSNVTGNAFVTQDNNGSPFLLRIQPTNSPGFSFNYATGIGGNVRDFIGNTITLINTNINGIATIGGINNFENFVTGIGGNFGNFLSNTFNLTNTSVSGTGTIGIDNNSIQYVTGFGGNAGFGTATFDSNSISILNSVINGTASIGNDNAMQNFVVGLGGNFADFTNNNIALDSSGVISRGLIGGINNNANFVTGIGGGNAIAGTAIFSNNEINISDYQLTTVATNLTTSLTGVNQAVGVNMNNAGVAALGNNVNLDRGTATIIAQIFGINNGSNTAFGLVATGAGDTISIANSIVNLSAIVAPGSPGTNNAFPTTTAGGGTIFVAPSTEFNVLVSP